MQNEPITEDTHCSEEEYRLLLTELEAALMENRRLRDQLKKVEKAVTNAERAAAEATRAHAKMVETLTETMRENTALSIERDMWRARAQRSATRNEPPPPEPVEWDVRSLLGVGQVTEEEARAIRKAMARLHHPDSGGNAERMKLWNAALDRIERRM